MRNFSRKIVVLAVVGGVLGVAGVAFAAWNAAGAGQGSAKAVSAVDLTTSVATPVAGLYPGASANLSLTVNNSNPYPVRVTTIGADPANGITVDAAHLAAGCAADNVTFVDTGGSFGVTAGLLTVPVGIAAKVGSNNGSTPISLTNAVRMIADANNACQGATFTVPVIVSGVSAAVS